MDDLLMPSDARRHRGLAPAGRARTLQWYVIPALAAVGLVGAMFLVGRLAGRGASIEEDLTRAMKQGLSDDERIRLSRQLIELLERGGAARGRLNDEYLLLSLGRIWRVDAAQPPLSPPAVPVRRDAAEFLLRRSSADSIESRKAAILAFSYWKGTPEAAMAIPRIVQRLSDPREDLDVRIAAAVALGSIASPADADVIAALEQVRNLPDDMQMELSWNAALALARLGQRAASGAVLKLLDRNELAQLTIYDREADPKNPQPRELNEYEIERFIINAMEAAASLDDPEISRRLRLLAASDPSRRVRSSALETLSRLKTPAR
jgi:hypothetical protein